MGMNASSSHCTTAPSTADHCGHTIFMYHRSCRFVKWTIEEATDLLAIPLQLILLQIPIRMILR